MTDITASFKGSGRFPKTERLHHRSLVEGLFRSGKTVYEFPFRASFRILDNEQLEKNFRHNVPENIGKLQMMVTVPKKKRRKATDRVLMRRRIKEAYRLHRHELKALIDNDSKVGTMSLAMVYIHDRNLPYKSVEEKMKTLLNKICCRVPLSE